MTKTTLSVQNLTKKLVNGKLLKGLVLNYKLVKYLASWDQTEQVKRRPFGCLSDLLNRHQEVWLYAVTMFERTLPKQWRRLAVSWKILSCTHI